MAKEWGYYIPEDVHIYGIKVKVLSRFSQVCTPEITDKLSKIVEYILGDLAGS